MFRKLSLGFGFTMLTLACVGIVAAIIADDPPAMFNFTCSGVASACLLLVADKAGTL